MHRLFQYQQAFFEQVFLNDIKLAKLPQRNKCEKVRVFSEIRFKHSLSLYNFWFFRNMREYVSSLGENEEIKWFDPQ